MDQIQVGFLREKTIDIEKCLTMSSTFTLFLSFSFFGCLLFDIYFSFAFSLPSLSSRQVCELLGRLYVF